MSQEEPAPDAVVALLLDDLPPPRLGTLLRLARKRLGLTRRDVANRIGTTATLLRRYERGDSPVPPTLIATLAECYGDALTAQLATRRAPHVEANRLVVGSEVRALDAPSAHEVLTQYVDIVSRLRRARPGEPIALRADDLVALSGALEMSTEQVEARITEILGCSRLEAHSLHSEMLRRKLVLPVAGLAASLAVVAGVTLTASTEPTDGHAPATPIATVLSKADTVMPTADAAAPATAPTTTAPPSTPGPTHEPAPAPVAPAVTPAAPATTAPVPAPAAAPEPAAAPRPPVITPDTTPMSIPPNETVTIIDPGTPAH